MTGTFRTRVLRNGFILYYRFMSGCTNQVTNPIILVLCPPLCILYYTVYYTVYGEAGAWPTLWCRRGIQTVVDKNTFYVWPLYFIQRTQADFVCLFIVDKKSHSLSSLYRRKLLIIKLAARITRKPSFAVAKPSGASKRARNESIIGHELKIYHEDGL